MSITLDGTSGITTPDVDSTTSVTTPLVTNAGTLALSATGSNIVTASTNGVERLRVTAAGSVGIGTNAPVSSLELSDASTATRATVTNTNNAAAGSGVNFLVKNGGTTVGNATIRTDNADNLAFFNIGGERARIDAGGRLLVGKSTGNNLSANGFEVEQAGNIRVTSTFDVAQFYRKTTAGSSGIFLTYSDVGSTEALVGAAFGNGTFGVLSDLNKKKNVEDARGYLDDLMQIRVVKYNWKTDVDDAPKELGWIAQEVEQVFPGMVTDMHGSKLLKKEVFVPMLLKAIQEQQAIIEALEARVAALETNA